MRIYCTGCERDVDARLTNGAEIYAHRPDLYALPFWKCDGCGNYVGCHHKTAERTRPLGNIPTPELRAARQKIHALLDPMWRSGKLRRKDVYRAISRELGYEFHVAEIKSVKAAREILVVVERLFQ